MSLTQETQHVAQAKGLLIEHLRGGANNEAFVEAFVDQVQDLEDVHFGLLVDRAIATAVGAQLDILGAIIGRERLGAEDDEYRLYVTAQIRVNVGSGTPEDILDILDLLIVNDFGLFEWAPAAFTIVVDDALTEARAVILADIVQHGRPGGVGASLEYTVVDDDYTFTF